MAKAKNDKADEIEKDARGQYARSDHGRKNDGVSSVKPRVLKDQPAENAQAKGSDGGKKRDTDAW